MKKNSRLKIAAIAALATLALTGCSQSAAPNEMVVHYGGGPIEAKKFKGCIEPSDKELSKPGDSYYSYPASQSFYDFRGGKGADSKPIEVVSSDNQTLTIPGQVTFELNTNCKVLTAFHDNIGKPRQAYMVEGDNGDLTYSKGWSKVLNTYIGVPLDGTLDRIAKKYTWRELYSDPTIKDEMNSAVNEQLKTLVNQQTDGDQEFFLNYNSLILQPLLTKELQQTVRDAETSVAQAQAQEAKAVADANAARAAADAQVAQKNAEASVAEAEARAQAATIAPYGSVENYNNYLAIQKGLNPFQPTYGGSTIVDAK